MTDLFELGTPQAPPSPRSRRARRLRRTIAVLVAACVLAVGIVAGLHALASLKGKPVLADYPGPGTGSVQVTIASGESMTEIGSTLVKAGVVATRQAFVSAASANPKSGSIEPGTYALLEKMPAAQAVAYLIGSAHRLSIHVTIPEGMEVTQAFARIAKADTSHTLTVAALTKAAQKSGGLGLPSYAHGKLEGFLFPATYDFDLGTTPTQAVQAMVSRFTSAATAVNLTQGADDLNHTPYEVLIVASIIEKESSHPSEYAKVARVIYNRLAAHKSLQLDSVVNYGLPTRKAHLSAADIAHDTPYNDYLHGGLPPTPIDNPGTAAIQAALAPASGNWLYFYTFRDTTNHFTKDYNEFLKWKQEQGTKQ